MGGRGSTIGFHSKKEKGRSVSRARAARGRGGGGDGGCKFWAVHVYVRASRQRVCPSGLNKINPQEREKSPRGSGRRKTRSEVSKIDYHTTKLCAEKEMVRKRDDKQWEGEGAS